MKKLLAVLMIVALLAGSGTPARAVDLKDIIGVVGGGFVVDAIAGPLNDFIDTITFNRGVGSDESTKVVPIVSVGSGTRIGAAQVSGPKNTINKTKAVAQVEVTFQGKVRVKILIPIDSKNPIERFRRVQGVGVSAVIDYDL